MLQVYLLVLNEWVRTVAMLTRPRLPAAGSCQVSNAAEAVAEDELVVLHEWVVVVWVPGG